MKTINHNAPVRCKRTVIINAHSVDVWEVLTGIDKWPSWQTDIKMAKLNGQLAPGVSFVWKSGGLKINSTLHTVEPYIQIGWWGKSLGIFAIHNWKLTELNKQTEVAVEESMEGFLARLFKPLLNKSLEKGMVRWLEFLKANCELKQK